MRKLLSSLILFTAILMPNCATFVANNPGLTNALANYNCRKGYGPCVSQVELVYYGPEVIYVYED